MLQNLPREIYFSDGVRVSKNKLLNSQPEFAIFEDVLNPTQKNSYYFSEVVAEVIVYNPAEFASGLAKIEQLRQTGLYLAGYIAYSASSAVYVQLDLRVENWQPLLHFVAYKKLQKFASQNLAQLYPEFLNLQSKLNFEYLELNSNYAEYLTKFEQVQRHLVAGDSYQLNLTLPVNLSLNNSDLFALYYQLSRSHPVAYASYLPFSPQCVLSISPELFFKKSAASIVVRPMKGTMPRGVSQFEDELNAEFLAHDDKNRAENLIIVDLLRNDLAKFCMSSSVKTTELFAVEKFRSLFQMTSKIKASLAELTPLATIIQGLFPCGSITGAPKLRTLQLIEQIEGYSRGIYSGAIGYILPNNDMQFSVAIRTLSANAQVPEQLKLGVGGGITVQSEPLLEWAEIATKLAFVRKFYTPNFNLIESFLVVNSVIVNYAAHLRRLKDSIEKLSFNAELAKIEQSLINYVLKFCLADKRYKLRLELSFSGEFKLEQSVIGKNPDLIKVALHQSQINTQHGLFRHKTDSHLTRGLYTQIDQNHKPAAIDELIFINQDGWVSESRYHNVIIEYQGVLMTPPVAQGLLPGIYRQQMLDKHELIEQAISAAMLQQATAIYLCNAVRGLIKCQLLEKESEQCS